MVDYTAYELGGGECLEDVEALCAQLTMDGAFGNETQPTISAVERWLTMSHAWVAGLLAKNGYAIVQTNEVVLGILQELNALDTAVKCELANPLTGIGEPNERFLELKARRDNIVEMIEESQMLTALGATTLPGGGPGSLSEHLIFTGLSKSRKADVESDTDLVLARFRHGQGRNIGDADWVNQEQ